MYIGYIMIVLGEAFLTGALILISYTILIFALIHAYVVHIEEPNLKKKFGKDYTDYKKRIPRWI
ncbi:MAG: methyltransferase family protein [Nanobdellota archaeon]